MNQEFDFDSPVDRRQVPSLKTHPRVLGESGTHLFAAGVADMDFKAAPPILDALNARLNHGIFGYEAVPDALLPALCNWMKLRHDWHINPGHILRAPNALNSLALAASLFSAAGDGIIVQPPVFFDFFDVIKENKRTIVENPLILGNGRYEMDLDGLETLAASPRNKILFLCNPHNPIGRVWTRAELQAVSDICLRHDVLVVSDELHGDLVFSGHHFVPFASLGADATQNSITITSPAKSFNIAGCCSAFTIISDQAKRARFQVENSRLTVNKNNAFANVAMLAAFQNGAPWLDAAIGYIENNLAIVRDQLKTIDQVQMIEPEGTFLLWLDLRPLELEPDALHEFLRHKARWAVSRGISFGQKGAGFVRVNIACRRAILEAALVDLRTAIAGN